MQRILVVSNLFPPHIVGGAEIVAWRQARQLLARGHAVSVFAGWTAPAGQAGRLEVERQEGLHVWRTPVASFEADDNFFIPQIGARLRSVLEAEQPDLVHFHNLNGLGFSLVPLVKRLGLPAVVTLHDHAGYCFRATALRPDDTACTQPEECAIACQGSIRPRHLRIALPMRLRRDYVAASLAQADRLISPSHALAAAFRAAGAVEPARIQVVSNGIDLAPFEAAARPPAGDKVRFICIAYLGEHKGIPDLLQAAVRLAAEPDLAGRWSLGIAGEGHLRGWLEREIVRRRLADAVRYLGRVPRAQIVAELAATDVVVLPSRWPENEPVVLLEAIAAGVAQLATDTGGIPELVQPGVTGELVPPGDPAALAAVMAAYIRDPGRARRHGAANHARRGQFAEAATITAIEDIYASVVAAKAPPRRDRPLVLCAGDWPLPQVAEICNNLFRLEADGARVRLVWHDWADAADWAEAALLWNWSSAPSHAAIRRALRAGVPILAPASCALVAGVEAGFGAALTYRTFLEAMAALARLPHDADALLAFGRNCRDAAAVLAASAPPEHYLLGAPVLET